MELYLQGDPGAEFMIINHFYESANIFETYPNVLVEYISSNHKYVRYSIMLTSGKLQLSFETIL